MSQQGPRRDVPFVVCFRFVSSMTSNFVPKRRFNNVPPISNPKRRGILFPVDCEPKTATRWYPNPSSRVFRINVPIWSLLVNRGCRGGQLEGAVFVDELDGRGGAVAVDLGGAHRRPGDGGSVTRGRAVYSGRGGRARTRNLPKRRGTMTMDQGHRNGSKRGLRNCT